MGYDLSLIHISAGAAAFDDETIFRAVLVLHQVIGAVDEVGEGVLLVHHAAGLVPRLAHLTAAADVGDGEHDATIDQRKIVGVEADIDRDAVGSVGCLLYTS